MDGLSATDEVSRMLHWAMLPDQSKRELAEGLIELRKQSPQFYIILMDVYGNESLSLQVRQLALIIIRTRVQYEWKVRPPAQSIFTGIKDILKKRIFESLNESNTKLASQICSIIGHIVGCEYPHEWRDALLVLCSGLFERPCFHPDGVLSPSTPLQINTIQALKNSLGTLCAKALPSTRRTFFACSPGIIHSLHACINDQLSLIFQPLRANPQLLDGDPGNSVLSACKSRLSTIPLLYKCLHKVILYAVRLPNMHRDIDDTLSSLFKPSVEYYKIYEYATGNQKLVLKGLFGFVHLLMKTFGDILDMSPDAYSSLQVAPSVPLFYLECLRNTNGALEKKFCVQIFSFLKMFVRLSSANKTLDELRKSVLAPNVVKELVLSLPEFFSCITDDDNELWKTNPSEYLELNSCSYNHDSTQTPAEDLISALTFHYRKDFVLELIEALSVELSVLSSYQNGPSDQGNVRRVCGLLCAIVCVVETLSEFVDIDEWLIRCLVPSFPMLLSHDILKYRLAILLGRVVHLKETGEFYLYYRTIVEMLGCDNIIIRMTAASSLQMMVEDLNFRSKEFEPLLQTAIEQLMSLLDSVNDEMHKSKVILYISDIVDRMEAMINPYAVEIMNGLSKVWDDYPDSAILRSEVIRALSRFVKTLNKINPQYTCNIVVNILKLCLSSETTSESAHLDDGLELWMSTLVSVGQELNNFTSNDPAVIESVYSLLEMFPYLLNLMANGTEYPEKILNVLKAYFLISPKFIINSHALKLFTLINSILSNLRAQSMYLLFECIDVIFLLSNCDGIFPKVEMSLIESGFLYNITLGFFKDADLPTITTGYLMLLCRIILCDAISLINFISYIGETHLQCTRSEAIKLFVECMEKKCEFLANKMQSRVCGMAAITLITTEDVDVIKNSHKIFSILATVFEDAELVNPDDILFPGGNSEDEDDIYKTQANHKNARSNDPVYTQLSITNLIKASTEQVLRGTMGPELRSQLRLLPYTIPTALKNCLPYID